MMKNKPILNLCILLCLTVLLTLPTAAKREVAPDIQKVSGNVYCLTGAGGNIGILKGNDDRGLMVIDSQIEPVAGNVLKKI